MMVKDNTIFCGGTGTVSQNSLDKISAFTKSIEDKKEETMQKLHNREIAEKYKNIEFCLMLSDFKGAFAYWVASQNPNDILDNNDSLSSYIKFIKLKYKNIDRVPEKFNCEKLKKVVNEDIFCAIPEILALNEMKPDFIDLGALARNVYFMILREVITQSDYNSVDAK